MKTIKDLKLKLATPKQKEVYERINLQPSRIEGYRHLARLLVREGDPAGGEGVLRFALSLFPKDRLTREQLASLYEETKRPARAVDIYRSLIREGESWSAYVRLSRIWRKKGDLEAAIAVYQAIPKKNPFRERVFCPLYDLYFMLGDHKRGIKNAEECLGRCGPSFQWFKRMGRLHMRAGDKTKGIDWLKKALRLNPADLDTLKLIGLAHLDLGNHGTARNWFSKILAQDPESYQARIELAELALRLGKLDEAKKWVDEIRRTQKKKGEIWDSRSKLVMADYCLRKKDYRQAVELAAAGLGETPFYYPGELINAHGILARGYQALEDAIKSEVHSRIEKELKENSDPFNAFIALARKLEKEKKLDQAKEVLEQLLITFPGNALTLLSLAEAQFKRGMTESAVQLARAAAASDPGSFVRDQVKALKLLVRISRAAGREGSARDYERRLTKLLSGESV